jgi:hypothetical protein
MQKFMSRFVDQTDQSLRIGLSGQQDNLSAVTDAKSGRDVLVVFKGDILLCQKLDESVPVLATSPVMFCSNWGRSSPVVCWMSKTCTTLNPINTGSGLALPSVLLLWSASSCLRRCPIMGARIGMPFSPRFTKRPNSFHVRIPATCVASGRARTMDKMLEKL